MRTFVDLLIFRFSWFHNNSELPTRSDENSLLIIENVQEHHAGIYTCFAFNRFGNAQANITLIVTSSCDVQLVSQTLFPFSVRPRFTFQTDGFLHGLLSQSLTLPCHHRASPRPTVRWFHNDQPIEVSSSSERERKAMPSRSIAFIQFRTGENDRWAVDATGSLLIDSLIVTDRGSYVCQVTNDIGQSKQQFQVDVYGKVAGSRSDAMESFCAITIN